MTIRAFIAVEITPDLQADIGNLSYVLSKKIPGVKWVSKCNFHITLRFLGDLEEETIPGVQAVLDKIANRYLPIRCKFDGLGVFPHQRRPRVIWLGIKEGSTELTGLTDALNPELAKLGFGPGEKRYIPHLTMGRLRKDADPYRLKKIIRAIEEDVQWTNSNGLLNIDMLVFKKSTLTPSGAVHENISEHGM